MDDQKEITWEVIFTGCVQGVGFRYLVRKEAMLMGLGGYVKNMGDGSVKMIVNAFCKQLTQFLKILKSGNGMSLISDAKITQINDKKYENFTISY